MSPSHDGNEHSQTVDVTRIACLNYLTHGDTNIPLAHRLFEQDPSLSGRDLFHACCAGDTEAVARMLSADSSLVNQRGGHLDWEPLMYACYSRVTLPGKSTMEVARLLLEHGADPNAHYMWARQYRFTALCGIFAEGEQGPVKFPEHPNCEAFARLLLEAGADPNDGQALYNRMFTPGSLCLKLMLEFGLNPTHHCNWLLQDKGKLVANPDQTLRYQLNYAIKSGYVERARLCIDHGADLSTPTGKQPLYETALLVGEPELADHLVSCGAERTEPDSTVQLLSACMKGDAAKTNALVLADPALLQRTLQKYPDWVELAAELGRGEALRLMAELGLDFNAHNPIFAAVWRGNLEIVKLLVELGVDPSVPDSTHHSTPMGWAEYHGERDAIATFLSTCDVDLFDAILSDNGVRITEILTSNPSHLNLAIEKIRPTTRAGNKATPLATAVIHSKPNAVKILLQHGADRSYIDAEGNTLADLARAHAAPEILTLLGIND